MNDAQTVQVLNSTDDLLKHLTSLLLIHAFLGYDVVEQFTLLHILHYQE